MSLFHLVALVVVCTDGGLSKLPRLEVQVRLPQWGATEQEVRQKFPGLVVNDGNDIEGATDRWWFQEIDSDLLSVRVFSIGVYILHDRLTRVLFDFGKRLDATESANRESLMKKFEAIFGVPIEVGDCWKTWRAADGFVAVEPGRVQFFAPGSAPAIAPNMVPGVDRGCRRLIPIRIPQKKPVPQRP